MNYSPQDLQQGMALRQKAQQNPQEAARTQMWNNRFSMSNEGMQFNQARMMMANPQPQQEQE